MKKNLDFNVVGRELKFKRSLFDSYVICLKCLSTKPPIRLPFCSFCFIRLIKVKRIQTRFVYFSNFHAYE